jgi:hypothetical protein
MHTPDKRRWWSYLRLSVRGLMLLVLVVGGGLGVIAHFIRSVAIQREAVAAVEKLNGSVIYDFQFEGDALRRIPGSNIVSQEVPGWPNCVVNLLGLDMFGDVKEVRLRYVDRHDGLGWPTPNDVDEVLVRVGQLHQLENLRLVNMPVTDAGLAHLEGLSKLRILELQRGNRVTDAGLIHLKRMTNLEQISLEDSQITGAGLSHLKALTDLEEVSLGNTQVDDAGLAHLKGLAKLNTLDVCGTRVTNAGLTHLKRLANLRMLKIGSTKITDGGIFELRRSLPKPWAPR